MLARTKLDGNEAETIRASPAYVAVSAVEYTETRKTPVDGT
jgi:hypothetical protein